jgi:hypothetical protein
MRDLPETYAVRWGLDPNPAGDFICLRNLGNSAAVDVRVQLSRGGERGDWGTLTFDCVTPGVALRLYRFASNPSLPPWSGITVTWRHGGWLARRWLHRWDASPDLSPTTAGRPARRALPTSSVRVPQQRRAASG